MATASPRDRDLISKSFKGKRREPKKQQGDRVPSFLQIRAQTADWVCERWVGNEQGGMIDHPTFLLICSAALHTSKHWLPTRQHDLYLYCNDTRRMCKTAESLVDSRHVLHYTGDCDTKNLTSRKLNTIRKINRAGCDV